MNIGSSMLFKRHVLSTMEVPANIAWSDTCLLWPSEFKMWSDYQKFLNLLKVLKTHENMRVVKF